MWHRVARLETVCVFATVGVLYVPTLWDLFHGAWNSETQGHGPVVLGISIWLLARKWQEYGRQNSPSPSDAWAWAWIGGALLFYIFGRSQGILTFEVGSIVPLLVGIVLLLNGNDFLKVVWFPLFFLCFVIPLPGGVVDALTQPMKMAVSWVVEHSLHFLEFPIARTGVMLQIGPYQLLVADACAGLHTLFTLEALGLLYLNVVTSSSWERNLVLALLIIPISFFANVVRVTVLVLVTYYFGDDVGQGFLHEFAGIVLFMSALMLIVFFDYVLRWSFRKNENSRHA